MANANIGAALEALKTGGDVEAAAFGQTDSESPDTESTVDEVESESPSDTLDRWQADEPEADAKDAESTDDEDSSEDVDTSEAQTDYEYLKTKSGKRIRVDYTDRERIKRAHQMAAGMRKFQQERDEARVQSSKLTDELSEVKGMVAKIKDAADRNDENELVRIMTGGTKDWDTMYKERREREDLRSVATEEELQQMDLQDKVAALETKLASQSTDLEERLGKAATDRDEAELSMFKSRMNPVFDKYRFAGKLGDTDAEYDLDRMLWNSAVEEIDSQDNITDEQIAKVFRRKSEVLNRVVDKKTDERVKTVSKNRKRVAKQAARTQQVKGLKRSSTKRDIADAIRSGDMTTAVRKLLGG